jgi:hypothetical protein
VGTFKKKGQRVARRNTLAFFALTLNSMQPKPEISIAEKTPLVPEHHLRTTDFGKTLVLS